MADVRWEIDPTSEDAANQPLSLTDSTYKLMEMDLTPPEVDAIYGASADTEGDPYVSSRHRNRTVALTILAQTATDTATQTAVYAVEQKIDKLRREGGTLKFTTKAGLELVGDVVSASYAPEFSLELYNLNKAVRFQISFVCKPYFRGSPQLLSDHAETTSPCLVFTETSLAGDVWGLGKLVIDEDDADDQWWMVWGIQSRFYDSTSTAALFYEAEGLTTQGGSSVVTGPTGASGGASNNVVRNTALGASYQSILSTQATGGGAHLSHVGSYRVFARFQIPQADAGTVAVALEWSEGDFRRVTRNAEVTFAPEVVVPGHRWGGFWRICDMGVVTLTKTAQGTQRWEGRILAKSTQPGDDIDIDWIMLVPVDEGSGEINIAPQLQTPTVFGGRDEFDHAAGDLNGKTAPVGGTWAADTAFDVETTGHTVTITGNTGELFAILGSTTYTDVLVETDFYWPAGGSLFRSSGVTARYVDTNNYVRVNAYASGGIEMVVRVASTVVAARSTADFPLSTDTWYRISTQIDASGRIACWLRQRDIPAGDPTLFFYSSALATGGALASGKNGIYDLGGTSALARQYDNFVAATIVKDAALFASQSCEVRHDRVIREDSGGTVWVKPSSYEGDYLRVPPAGREARTVRAIVKMSRNRLQDMADVATDDVSARMTYTPRYLVLGP